jgi:hypothetical protein
MLCFYGEIAVENQLPQLEAMGDAIESESHTIAC